MTELHPFDLDPEVAERIRRRARAALADEADRGTWARVERALVRWIEPPLVAVLASGLLFWSLAATL